MLIGLDLPEITTGLQKEGVSLGAALGYGFLISAVLIIVRLISAYGAVVVTLIMRNFINVADANPGMRAPLLLGWTGMRGVVSLAAALSIPVQLNATTPFPHRNLILFITFIVILTTLLLQGLTLPLLIRKIKLPAYDDYIPDEEADTFIRRELARQALSHLHANHADKLEKHSSLQRLADRWNDKADENNDPGLHEESKTVYLELLELQRRWLLEKNKTDDTFDEDLIRKYLYQIDIEEEKLKYL
jgi:CPA1 family monovalent cation:H+ antiporter